MARTQLAAFFNRPCSAIPVLPDKMVHSTAMIKGIQPCNPKFRTSLPIRWLVRDMREVRVRRVSFPIHSSYAPPEPQIGTAIPAFEDRMAKITRFGC